ncbi:MAG: argininosuccinate lyase [Vicinamibacteria bacterium]|nr:argininosuccinate lyase [Vicinamibacteria bacterium]
MLWGGNYQGDPDRAFWEFGASFGFDRRLLAEEIAASRAYARALGECGAIPREDARTLDAGLAQVLENARAVPGYLDLDVEDVHSFVETRLGEIVGELAGQGHLARSRNEQTVTALRMYVRGACDRSAAALGALVEALCDKGTEGAEAVMPGFTHVRAAEPITFGFWAGAYAWGFARDRERFQDARRRANRLPLGSGALAGTPLALDRMALARELGFDAPSPNALDAVSDRDFAAEFAFACAQTQTRLSRLSEELIWHSGPEFGFYRLPDAYTTGSSLMPQKKNPDALELLRGKAARVQAAVQRLLVMQKGLPAGYQKDLQEDKEAVFDAADTVLGSLPVATGVIAGLALDRDAMRRAASREELFAATLAVTLARDGLAFRRAHHVVGALVAEAQASGRPLREVARERLQAEHSGVAARIDTIFDPDEAVRAKAAEGGTAPETVRASLATVRGLIRS